MDTMKSGRRYDREFEQNAAALVRGDRSATEVARDLGVSTSTLNQWVALAEAGMLLSKPKTRASETLDQCELRRLHPQPAALTSAVAVRGVIEHRYTRSLLPNNKRTF